MDEVEMQEIVVSYPTHLYPGLDERLGKIAARYGGQITGAGMGMGARDVWIELPAERVRIFRMRCRMLRVPMQLRYQ